MNDLKGGIALDHAVLHFNGAARGVGHAAELDDQSAVGALRLRDNAGQDELSRKSGVTSAGQVRRQGSSKSQGKGANGRLRITETGGNAQSRRRVRQLF